MKKLILTIPVILVLLFALNAADDQFSDLNDAQKLDLSEAYQAVGEHFSANGEEDRGQAYEETAEILRSQITDLSAAAAARKASMAQTAMAAPAEKKVSEDEAKAVKYYFRKLVRAVLSENTGKIISILDDPFSVKGYLSGISEEKIINDLNYIFEAYDLTMYDSYDLYYMDDLSLSYDENSEDIIILEATATTSGEGTILENLLFWEKVQKFYFKKTDQGWKVFAIL